MKYVISAYLKSGLILESFTYHKQEAQRICNDFHKYCDGSSEGFGSYKMDQESPQKFGTCNEILQINFSQVDALRLTELNVGTFVESHLHGHETNEQQESKVIPQPQAPVDVMSKDEVLAEISSHEDAKTREEIASTYHDLKSLTD